MRLLCAARTMKLDFVRICKSIVSDRWLDAFIGGLAMAVAAASQMEMLERVSAISARDGSSLKSSVPLSSSYLSRQLHPSLLDLDRQWQEYGSEGKCRSGANVVQWLHRSCKTNNKHIQSLIWNYAFVNMYKVQFHCSREHTINV